MRAERSQGNRREREDRAEREGKAGSHGHGSPVERIA